MKVASATRRMKVALPTRRDPSPRQLVGRRGAGWVATRAILLTVCVVWSVPTVGLLASSFRPKANVNTTGWWTVLSRPGELADLTIENYRQVLFDQHMAESFLNTVTVTLPTTVLQLSIALFAAYAFSWIRFRGREVLFIVFIVGLLVIPLHLTFIPLLQLFSFFGISGSFLSIWLAHTAYGLPVHIFILRRFMETMPRDLVDQAHVDGASHYQIFWRIAVPLTSPAIAAVAIFHFLAVWNDLLIALVFLGARPATRVLTINLALLLGSRGEDWHLLTAGAFVTMVVPLLVFIFLQRYFVRGLSAGAVKG